MKSSISKLGISKIANAQVSRLEQFDKLKEIANRNNYPHKVKLLTEKIQNEFHFWVKKNHLNKLEDLERDLSFIQTQANETTDKSRIDLLMEKYGLK
jgi:hypothetical protein